MKKLLMVFCILLMAIGAAPSAFAEYAEFNAGNAIDWYNIIDGVKERDYRSVSRNQAPFHFSFNGFMAEDGVDYVMTLRHAGNSDSSREQWDLYLEGDDDRVHIDDLVYSNDWAGADDWLWVDQAFSVSAENIAAVGDNWHFSLEVGTKRYSVVDLDRAGIAAVPVPGSILLLGAGLLGLAGLRQRQASQA